MVWFSLYLQTFSVNSDWYTIRLEQYCSLKYPRKVPWKAFFWLLEMFLINLYRGTIQFDPYCPFRKTLSIFIEQSYDSCVLNALRKTASGLTRIVHLDQSNQSLSKMVWFALYLQTFSVNSDRDTIRLEQYCFLKYLR